MKEQNLLAIDVGFGDLKLCYNGELAKEVSALARISSKAAIKDENALEFNGEHFYVFNNATKLPDASQIDTSNYDGLKYATPIYVKALEARFETTITHLCLGLSIAMLDKGHDYKSYVAKMTGIIEENIFLLPQGIGSKVAYTKYGLDHKDSTKLTGGRSMNYLGVDIGFNTIDAFQVIDGKTSSNATKGTEGTGLIKVATAMMSYIFDEYKVRVSLSECKLILAAGTYHYRGDTLDLNEWIKEQLLTYLVGTFQDLEDSSSESINKMDNILLVGGGAALYQKYADSEKVSTFMDTKYKPGFIIIPKASEYFNVLGYYLFAESKL